MHLATVGTFNFQRCPPGGPKTLHIGLDPGGRFLVCCRTGEKEGGGHLLLLYSTGASTKLGLSATGAWIRAAVGDWGSLRLIRTVGESN